MSAIPLLLPDMPKADDVLHYLRRIDEAKWYTNFGPLSVELEDGLAATLGDPPPLVASVSNCTLGLELALSTLGLSQGDGVLVPALTFVATATAVIRAGFRPILADVDPSSWILTPEIARAALASHQIKCVMPVATYGCPQPASGWDLFARQTGIPVVIDAAGALGNQDIGESNIVVFSLHATKSFGVGEGGLVVSRDRSKIEKVRQLSNFGLDVALGVARLPGTNAKMSEYHAAVGLAVLDRWPERQDLRRRLIKGYEAALASKCPRISLQERPREGIYTIMQVLLPDGVNSRDVASCLQARQIQTRVWYFPPLEMHPVFSDCVTVGSLPVLRSLAPRMLGLPFYLGLKDAELDAICQALSEALTK